MTWNVYYYKTPSGRMPVQEFVEKQDKQTQTSIRGMIMLLSQSGPFLKPPYIKKIKQSLFELRIKGLVSVRIFYSPKNNSYYLIHAFKKKSQKTPSKEIKVAIDRLKTII